MVNKFGVHVGVGDVCAASVPAQREIATASITGRIARVRFWIKSSISRAVRVSDAAASVKLPVPADPTPSRRQVRIA